MADRRGRRDHPEPETNDAALPLVPADQRAYGDFLDKPQRYARCAEFLDLVTRLWAGETAGVGLLRGGAGTALAGSHAEVADRIEEYARLGLSDFILSGYPHLEEAYWFGEGVLPILAARGLWRHPAEAAGILAPVPLSVN